MATVTRTVVVKTMSEAQLNWAFKRGMIWEDGGRFFSKKYEYYWVAPWVERNGEVQGGCFEVLETKLVNI